MNEPVEESCILICKNCQAEKHHGGKYCQNCGGTEFMKHYTAILGDVVEASLEIAKENPPIRVGAKTNF